MKRSSDRILTTHTGSLSRPEYLMPLLRAKEAGEAYDATSLAAQVKSAVAEAAQIQVAAGIHPGNPGQMRQPSNSTHGNERTSRPRRGKKSCPRAARPPPVPA